MSRIVNQFDPDSTMITKVTAELESIVKLNNKPLFQEFSMKGYEAVMEIISSTVRRYTSASMTFAAAGRPVKNDAPKRRCPPQGKDIRK